MFVASWVDEGVSDDGSIDAFFGGENRSKKYVCELPSAVLKALTTSFELLIIYSLFCNCSSLYAGFTSITSLIFLEFVKCASNPP